ncbi:MAG: sulfurtransferase TusA family protein [Hyphomicrobiaceae bacterium]
MEHRDMADKRLDTRGLTCPLPVLKASKVLKEMAPGTSLEVLATDPGSIPDFAALCERGRHTLLNQIQENGVYRFLIRRAD